MSEAAVEVAHVSKSYHRGGTTVPVLDDINLVVARSSFRFHNEERPRRSPGRTQMVHRAVQL